MKQYLEDLIISNMGLANHIASSYYATAPHALCLDDLKGIAYEGLVQAATRWEEYCEKNSYDPSHVHYFSVYADRRMRGAIVDHFRSVDWATRNLRTKWKKLKEAGLEEGATETELAEESGMSVKEIRSTLTGMSRKPVSLEATFQYTSDQTTSSTYSVTDTHTFSDKEDKTDSKFWLKHFAEAVIKLSEEAQIILAMHYYKRKDLKSIANELELNSSYVSQVHTSSVEELLDNMKDIVSDII